VVRRLGIACVIATQTPPTPACCGPSVPRTGWDRRTSSGQPATHPGLPRSPRLRSHPADPTSSSSPSSSS
jgi:hypothetical protein